MGLTYRDHRTQCKNTPRDLFTAISCENAGTVHVIKLNWGSPGTRADCNGHSKGKYTQIRGQL